MKLKLQHPATFIHLSLALDLVMHLHWVSQKNSCEGEIFYVKRDGRRGQFVLRKHHICPLLSLYP